MDPSGVPGKVYNVSCCDVRGHTCRIALIVKDGEACFRKVGYHCGKAQS